MSSQQGGSGLTLIWTKTSRTPEYYIHASPLAAQVLNAQNSHPSISDDLQSRSCGNDLKLYLWLIQTDMYLITNFQNLRINCYLFMVGLTRSKKILTRL